MNLRQKIRWVLLGVAVLPLTLLVGLNSVRFFEASQADATEHLVDLAATSARTLNDILTSAARDTRALATAHRASAQDGAALTNELTRFNINYPYFKELLWVNPSGVVLASSHRAHAGQRIERLYDELGDDFQRVLQQPSGQLLVSDLDNMSTAARDSEPAGRRDENALTLQFLLRVDDARGQALGVLVTELHVEAIREVLRDAERRTPGALPGELPVILLNRQGRVLMTSRGTQAAGHGWVGDLTTVLPSRNETEYAVLLGDTHGQDVVAVASLPGLPGAAHAGDWRVLVTAPLEVLTASARRTLQLTVMLTVGVATVCVVLSLWLARRFGRRIEALLGGVQAVGRGEFAAPLPIESTDELGALAQAFNRMAQDILTLLQDKDAAARQQQALSAALEVGTVELQRTVACMERQNREITLRNELGDLLQSCISVEEAGAVMARFVPKLFPGASGAAYLNTPAGETLVPVSHWGEAPGVEALTATDCWALRRGRTYLVTESELLCPHAAAPLAGTSVCVPLSAHGEALGLLHMMCPGACRHGEATVAQQQALAEAVAAQCAMALANLRLRESLHEQSIRDALTGLYNRRYLEGTLPRELSRAQRGERPLAVFMLDVDHFKAFNDNHGHDAGDAVLKALGHTLRDACRTADIACRFGGEEFTLVLPDADERAAREWAERLLNRVRTLQVKANGQTLPQITVSMGLALLPEHGNDAETLLQAADLALYDAKHAGRDRLVVSSP